MFDIAKYRLMEGEDGSGASASAAPVATPAPAATPSPAPAAPDAGLTPPASLFNEPPAEPKPTDEPKPTEKPTEPVPIEYKDFNLPEGVHVMPERMEAFKAEAAKAGMSQDAAQKFVDMYGETFKQLSEAPMRAWTELQNKWQDEVRADPVIGGENLDRNLAMIKSGLNNLLGEGAKDFYDALNLTGAGNNPAIIRGLLKAAAPHAPASPISGRPGGSQKTAGSILYPTMAGLGNGHEG